MVYRFQRILGVCLPLGLASGLSPQLALAEGDVPGLADMSLEDLVNMDVFQAANLLPTEASKAPGTVYRFDQGDFNRFGVRRLADLLQFVPGFQLSQYRKRHRSIWSRGMLQRYNDKLILLVDGVRQQHFYYGHFDLGDNLALEQIESVEIIQGPASSLYGANALSGLISVKTKDFSALPQLQVSAEYGDNHRSKVTGLYNSENVQVFGSYLDQHAAFRDSRESFIGSEVMQPLDESYQSFYIKARPVEGLTLKLDYNKSTAPFLFIPPTQDGFVEYENWAINASYDVGDFETGRLEVDAFYQDNDGREFEKEQVTRRHGYEEFQSAVMAGINATLFKRYGSHTLALGGSWSRDEAKETEYERLFHFARGFLVVPETGNLLAEPKIVNEDFAVFLQDVWQVTDDLSVTLGTRHDKFDRFGEYTNYRVAAVYSQPGGHTWKFLYGTGIRPPSPREYLKVLEGTTFVAPIPKAERMKSYELSYGYSAQRVKTTVTAFHNRVDDFISEMPTPDGADEFFANSFSSVDMVGIEGVLDVSFSDDFDMRLSASYTDVSSPTYGNTPYVASWLGSVLAHYHLNDSHRIGMSFIYNDNRRDLNSDPSDDAESFIQTNLFVEGQLSPQLNYRLGVDNLLDDTIVDPAADFGPQHNTERTEREIWLSITWKPEL